MKAHQCSHREECDSKYRCDHAKPHIPWEIGLEDGTLSTCANEPCIKIEEARCVETECDESFGPLYIPREVILKLKTSDEEEIT